MSNHIKRLEEELDTKLFVRSPRLQMIETGRLLYTSLQKIRRIEEQVREAIADSSEMVHGHLLISRNEDFTSRYIRDFRQILLEEYRKSVHPLQGISSFPT